MGEIGLKNPEFLRNIVSVLIDVLDDDTPGIVRQAILCGIDLFHFTLFKITILVIGSLTENGFAVFERFLFS